MENIFKGLFRFQREIFPAHEELFEALAEGQQPTALMITCGDSRIVPGLMTQTKPGELFICRNAGNIVPTHSGNSGGITATIEYAVEALRVPSVIICGHSDCGAMKAVLNPDSLENLPKVRNWLSYSAAAAEVVKRNYSDLPEAEKLEILIKENVIAQLENLKTHPAVAARLSGGDLRLFGWFYSICDGHVESYDGVRQQFERVREGEVVEATPARRLLRPTNGYPSESRQQQEEPVGVGA